MGHVRRRATELPAKKCCRGTSDLPRGQPNNLFSKSWFDPGGAAKSWFIPPQVLDSTCTGLFHILTGGVPKRGACESLRLSPCVLVQPDGWARGEREGYGDPAT